MNGAGNDQSIAAVTAALQRLLEDALQQIDPSISVLTDPPDKVKEDKSKEHRVNLFLYNVSPNTAWRNMDLPPRGKAAARLTPPLSLNLHYIVTPYSESDVDHKCHLMLGKVMSLLHDHTLLSRNELKNALFASDLHTQIEPVTISLQPLSNDEMSKLWSAFQSQYRTSVAYQVGVVLIESQAPRSAPLPVLKRGAADQGVFVRAQPSPLLDEVHAEWRLRDEPPNGGVTFSQVRPSPMQPAARLGDRLTLRGQYFSDEVTGVRFTSPRLSKPLVRKPTKGSLPNTLEIPLDGPGDIQPGDASNTPAMSLWVPGLYGLELVVEPDSLPPWASNTLPFSLAPAITVSPNQVPAGPVSVIVQVTPRLRDGQQPVLLVGGKRQVQPASIQNPADLSQPTTVTFNFTATAEERGEHLVRLRVDGAESLPYAYQDHLQIVFDPQQKLEIT